MRSQCVGSILLRTFHTLLYGFSFSWQYVPSFLIENHLCRSTLSHSPRQLYLRIFVILMVCATFLSELFKVFYLEFITSTTSYDRKLDIGLGLWITPPYIRYFENISKFVFGFLLFFLNFPFRSEFCVFKHCLILWT